MPSSPRRPRQGGGVPDRPPRASGAWWPCAEGDNGPPRRRWTGSGSARQRVSPEGTRRGRVRSRFRPGRDDTKGTARGPRGGRPGNRARDQPDLAREKPGRDA